MADDLEVFNELEEDDRILFNDRKTPLKVTDIEDDRVLVEGPQGGEYEIYTEDDTLLVAKPGNRRYASYCKDIREVGRWKKDNDTWQHSKTGARIELEKNDVGYWTIEAEGIDIEEIDLPLYGYSDKEVALEDVEKFISKHPEGR